MTSNQIAYYRAVTERQQGSQQLAETKRSNLAKETETSRSNLARERETNRANLINEGFKAQEISETQRANLAREGETKRSNLARETETLRSNQVKERETERSNKAREAETSRSNLATESETRRSNIARETETNRSNVVNEKERERSNKANEALTSERNSIARDTNIINMEHFQRMDSETNRHNLVTERQTDDRNSIELSKVQLGYDQIEGNYRNVLTSAGAQKYAADTNANLGYANLAELNRSNLEREWLNTNIALENVRTQRKNDEFREGQNAIAGYEAQTRRLAQLQQQNEWPTKQENLQSQTALNRQRSQSEQVNRRLATVQTGLNAVDTGVRAGTSILRAASDLVGRAIPFLR